MARAYIGISGWTYRPWRGVFYPKGLVQKRELEYASRRVSSIEINGSFYSLQRPTSWVKWRDEVPGDFLFAVKGPRFISHIKRLVDIEAPLANFFASGILAFGEKLGPILWQLPATFRFDPVVLDAFLSRLPRTTTDARALAARHDERMEGRKWFDVHEERPLRYAFEVRSTSFETPEWAQLLRSHNVSSVAADTAGKWPYIDETTADFGYARLHGDKELYASGYDEEGLDRWEGWCRGHLDAGRDVYVYFDNDIKVRAPFDAIALIERLRPQG
ncbi:DUF72 domain-containing protein [Rathayibacter sp. YIM 133350]|uniref:DUF72 domain-containing protein n=1 Tax=Rathayibacter sp. YIM 133350 TaxID=3131992 RepID=UPI00307D68BC